MIPRGLIKATAYYNNAEAQYLWDETARTAIKAGVSQNDIASLSPAVNWGWRKTDKATNLLRKLIYEKKPDEPCPKCGQVPNGQSGEYPCLICGLPTLHDDPCTEVTP